MGGNQGGIEEADMELDEEGEEGHRKFMCERRREEERRRVWRKGHYYRQFEEERDSGNIVLFQTYIKHDTNTPSERKMREEWEKTDSEGRSEVYSQSHCVLDSCCDVTEFMF